MPSTNHIAWAKITGAHGGPVTQFPEMVRRLQARDTETRQQAHRWMWTHLINQGSRCEASVAATPYLVDLAAREETPDRGAILALLAVLATGDDSNWLPDVGGRLRELRHDVSQKAKLSETELYKEQEAWIASAPNEHARRSRQSDADWNDAIEVRDTERLELAVYDAIREGVPAFCAALSSNDPDVRMAAAYILAWFPDDQQLIIPHLTCSLQTEGVAAIRATLAIAMGAVGSDGDASLLEPLTRYFLDSTLAERWAAAIGLARFVAPDHRSVAEALMECIRMADRFQHQVLYLGGDMASLAAVFLAELYVDVDSIEPVEVLMAKLGHAAHPRSAFILMKYVLKSVFPPSLRPSRVPFDKLSSTQQYVLANLASLGIVGRYWFAGRLLMERDLPCETEALDEFVNT